MEDIKFEMEKLQLYTARVDRNHPSAFVFLIDQSGSMQNTLNFQGKQSSKAQAVADALNSTLEEIIGRCTKADEIRHYFDIAIITYGQNSQASMLYHNEKWMSPEKLSSLAQTKQTQTTKIIRGIEKQITENKHFWITPTSDGLTPMYSAFNMARNLLEEWCDNHKGDDCFPPIVINITDGEQTDSSDQNMVEIANKIKSLKTIDGNALLFNIHLSDDDLENSIAFPSDISEMGGNSFSEMLFEMSSQLPEIFNTNIKNLTKIDHNSYRAMGLNTRAEFVHILNIGTQTTMSADDE